MATFTSAYAMAAIVSLAFLAFMCADVASAHSSVVAAAARQAQAGDIGARRHYRHSHTDRSPYTSYYGRPYYYAPATFFPIPPFFGFGWEPY